MKMEYAISAKKTESFEICVKQGELIDEGDLCNCRVIIKASMGAAIFLHIKYKLEVEITNSIILIVCAEDS